ncbi:MAG TPA: hypothetical protein VFZ98_11395, partial [Vicinamibacterales bacterium]
MKWHYASLAVLAALAHDTASLAHQTTPPAQQTTSPAQPASASQPQRAGGRGRGGVQLLTITTSAWADGG